MNSLIEASVENDYDSIEQIDSESLIEASVCYESESESEHEHESEKENECNPPHRQDEESESLVGAAFCHENDKPPVQQGGDLLLKGVSVYYLKHILLQEVQDAGFSVNDVKIYELEDDFNSDALGLIRRRGINVTCPRDGQLGAAYVDAIEQSEDYTGQANVMLSYARGCGIKEIVNALVAKCKTDGLDLKETYVWMYCLCNNQHRTSSVNVSIEEFRKTIYDTITDVGRVWSLMSPWDKPECLKRTWCLFEIYVASSVPGVEVELIIPEDQEENMIESLEDFYKLLDDLSKTNIENTDTSREDDNRNILDLVEGSVGLHELNKNVRELYRGWISGRLVTVAEQRKMNSDDVGHAKILYGIGCALFEMGDNNKAIEMFERSLIIRLRVLGEQSETAQSYNNIGLVKYANGDYDGALEMLKKSLAIREMVFGKYHVDTANTFNNIAEVKRTMRDYDSALEAHNEALAIRERVLGNENIDTGHSYNNIALVKYDSGDHGGALEMLKKSLKIRINVLGENHPETAQSYNNIAEVKKAKGDFNGALEMHKKALSIREKVLGLHTSTALSYNNIGLIKQAKGDKIGALEMFEKSLAIHEKILGKDHALTAASYKNVEVVKNT